MKRLHWWFVIFGLVVVRVLAFFVVLQLGGGTPQVKGLLGEPNNWAQVCESGVSSPPKRDNCSMVYDPRVDRVLLFGGNSQEGNDTWAYDPASNTWTAWTPPVPFPWRVGALPKRSSTCPALP